MSFQEPDILKLAVWHFYDVWALKYGWSCSALHAPYNVHVCCQTSVKFSTLILYIILMHSHLLWNNVFYKTCSNETHMATWGKLEMWMVYLQTYSKVRSKQRLSHCFMYCIPTTTWLFSPWFYFHEFRESDPRENFHFNLCLFIVINTEEKLQN